LLKGIWRMGRKQGRWEENKVFLKGKEKIKRKH
jgi:hypothetical protein